MIADGTASQEQSSVGAAHAAATRAVAVPLPEELMSSVLVYLRMKDMLEWRAVSSLTQAM